MRYMDEIAIDLKIQDLVDEKGLSRQCLFQLRDKQTGLENLKNLEKVYFKFNYSMKKSSQLQRIMISFVVSNSFKNSRPELLKLASEAAKM